VRTVFGNKAHPVSPQTVQNIRAATKDQPTFYQASEMKE